MPALNFRLRRFGLKGIETLVVKFVKSPQHFDTVFKIFRLCNDGVSTRTDDGPYRNIKYNPHGQPWLL